MKLKLTIPFESILPCIYFPEKKFLMINNRNTNNEQAVEINLYSQVYVGHQ